jgi:hypothetical protein
MFRSFRDLLSVLLLTVALLAPGSTTAEAAELKEPAWSLCRPWDWAAQLWSALGQIWTEGPSIDPNGSHAPTTETPESGCSLDPSGRCGGGEGDAETATVDAGCSLDPNGGCKR